MGLFDFFGKKGPKTEDLTWINQDAKMVGALHTIDQNPKAQVVAWSYLTKDEYEKYFLDALGMRVKIEIAPRVSSYNMRDQEVYFLEHHLFYSPEIQLIENWMPAKTTFLNSIEDPVFEPTISEKMISLMQRMGMEENEVIQHSMISKSIQKAQKDFEENLDIQALPPDVKEWFDTFANM